MLKINFQKLNDNLEKYKKDEPSSDFSGLGKVISYVWNHYSTSMVDFNSFSYQDVMDAIQTLQEVPSDDGDYEEDNPQHHIEVTNPWLQNMIAENACSNLHRSKNKVYENDDDFI